MVTRRLQAERRTGSAHRPKTGVLPTVLRNQHASCLTLTGRAPLVNVSDTFAETTSGSKSSDVDVSFVGPTSDMGGRRCVAVDGSSRSREDGESWWDGCRRCFCHDGHEMCALITCPALRCINPVLRADSCCPSCPGTSANTA